MELNQDKKPMGWLDKMISRITGNDDEDDQQPPIPLIKEPVAKRFEERAPVDMQNRYENLSNAGMVDPNIRGDFEGAGAELGVNPEVWDRLTNMKAQQERMNSPAYMLSQQRNINRDNTAPDFIANMGSALAQVGTINGQVADTSPLQKYASTLSKYRQQVTDNGQFLDKQQRQGVRQDVQDQLKLAGMQAHANEKNLDRDSAENRALAIGGSGPLAAQRMKEAKEARDRKYGMQLDERVSKFAKDMNEWRQGPGSAYGKAANLDFASRQVLALKPQVAAQEGGLDARQAHELAIATARLIGGGSQTAQATIEALVPRTIWNKPAEIAEWLLSEPKGINQQKFAERMFETAEREGHTAREAMKKAKSQVLGGYEDLANNPITRDRYNKIVGNTFSTDDLEQMGGGFYEPKPFEDPNKKKQELPPTQTIRTKSGEVIEYELMPNGKYRKKQTAPAGGQ